jgi:hypothetical protein
MIGRLRERGRPDGTRDVWSTNIAGLWTELYSLGTRLMCRQWLGKFDTKKEELNVLPSPSST